MAKAAFQHPVVSYSGHIGNLVFVLHSDGAVYVRRMPKKIPDRKPGQLVQQSRISAAAQYWREIQNDPVKLGVYLALPKMPRLGYRHYAIRDYCRPPVIGEIDVIGYSGERAQCIRATVTDDTAVAEVKVSVLDMQAAVLEEGSAGREGTSDQWLYRTTTQVPPGQSVRIRIVARDHPGNTVTRTVLAYTGPG